MAQNLRLFVNVEKGGFNNGAKLLIRSERNSTDVGEMDSERSDNVAEDCRLAFDLVECPSRTQTNESRSFEQMRGASRRMQDVKRWPFAKECIT